MTCLLPRLKESINFMELRRIGCTEVRVFDDRSSMGKFVAKEIVVAIKELLEKKEEVNIIFGAAPSQIEVLSSLTNTDIPFHKINAFQQDEYIGLSNNSEYLFSQFLQKHIFSKKAFKKVFSMKSDNSPTEECDRYTSLLHQFSPDIALIGFGENGHIAFNEPHEANFNDPLWVKTVTLDSVCRNQQVADKAFEKIEDVPFRAITLTIPSLLMAEYVFCTVPTERKASAVYDCMTKEVSEKYPGSIIREKEKSKLYLDRDSGKYLIERRGI